jgi:hypothetical protein
MEELNEIDKIKKKTDFIIILVVAQYFIMIGLIWALVVT